VCFSVIIFYSIGTKKSISCLHAAVFYRQKIDEQKGEIERLEHILDGKVEAEKKNTGNSPLWHSELKREYKNQCQSSAVEVFAGVVSLA